MPPCYTFDVTKADVIRRIRAAIPSAPFVEQIERVSLFGSYAYGQPREDSDVDILIELTEPLSLLSMARLQSYLAGALGKNVDLLTPRTISRYIRDEVIAHAQLIYEVRSPIRSSHS